MNSAPRVVALESALAVRISHRIHRVDELSFHTQLVCLHDFVEPEVARRSAFVWSALSQATHHHGYELPPAATSLREWMDVVGDVVERLRLSEPER